MSNEEIIREIRNLADKHKYDSVLTFGTNYHMAFTDIANHIEEQAEENTKLKAEIENSNRIISNMMDEHECGIVGRNIEIVNLKAEIEQLKAELEQSVIKCTHGYDKRQNEIGETLTYCEHTDNWMNVTLGECLGNCEAEERSV